MKYLLMLLISVFFFALTYASAPMEFTRVDLGIIICLLAGVLTVEFLIAHLFTRYRILQNLILAGFATINILYLNLVLNEGFNYLPIYGRGLGLLLALFILFTFMNMQDENTIIAWVLPASFAVVTAGVLAPTLFSAASVSGASTEYGKTSAKNIRIVDFESKPNVYFIGFDSLIPKVLLQKYLSLETTAYHEVLDANFQRFRNFFSDGALTKPSLNSLLALDLGHFKEAAVNKTEYDFFPGLVPSPLFEIFKHNGYETTTLHNNFYFGTIKGPYVDNYLVNRSIFNNAVCQFLRVNGLRAPTLMGYCRLLRSVKVRTTLMKLGFVDKEKGDIDFLIDSMRAGLQNDIPQILVAYIWSPGHTITATFDRKADGVFDKYKQKYFKNSKATASHLNKIVTFISREDPEAVVYVFGDHGPYISRRDTFEEDSTFFVQDRFGVYGGIHPRGRCAKPFSKPYNKDFMTVTQGAHMIIRCLSGGKDAFLTLEDYYIPGLETKIHNHYQDYLYE